MITCTPTLNWLKLNCCTCIQHVTISASSSCCLWSSRLSQETSIEARILEADFYDNVDEELAVGQIVKSERVGRFDVRGATLNSIRSYLRHKFSWSGLSSFESWAESVKVPMQPKQQKDNKKLPGLAAHDNKTGGTCWLQWTRSLVTNPWSRDTFCLLLTFHTSSHPIPIPIPIPFRFSYFLFFVSQIDFKQLQQCEHSSPAAICCWMMCEGHKNAATSGACWGAVYIYIRVYSRQVDNWGQETPWLTNVLIADSTNGPEHL